MKENSNKKGFVMFSRATRSLHGRLLYANMCLERCVLKVYWAKLSTMTIVICSDGGVYKILLSLKCLTIKYRNNKRC